MREIKFRLRDIDNKIVGYEKWYSGSYNKEENFWVALPCWLYSEDGKEWTPTYIFHNHKDQFTGLLDKNGKEIYEGGVVKRHFIAHNGITELSAVGTIEWDGELLAGYYIKGRHKQTREARIFESEDGHMWLPEELEVIGNIHENPELLTP